MPQSFKCPTCSAPLEFEGKMMQKCTFCGSNVIVPSEMFTKPDKAESGDGSPLDENALKIAEIRWEIQRGSKINAIRLFREAFGGGLKEAKEAVDAMAAGKNIHLSNIQIQPMNQPVYPHHFQPGKRRGYIGFTIAIIIMFFIPFVAGFLFFVADGNDSFSLKSLFSGSTSDSSSASKTAEELLRFGGEGTGAGKFKDNRSIGIDGQNRIYTMDELGDNIQVFDENGEFLSQFTVTEKIQSIVDTKPQLRSLSVDRNGNLYVLNQNEILKYEGATGKLLKKAKSAMLWDLESDADGNLIAVDNNGSIMRYDKNLKQTAVYKDAAKKADMKNGFYEVTTNDQDEIFMITTFNPEVFKFSKDGEFLDRFKIDADTAQRIAVDKNRRIFVSAANKILVYDDRGIFINSFDTAQPFDISFNGKDEVIVAARPFVMKYKLNF